MRRRATCAAVHAFRPGSRSKVRIASPATAAARCSARMSPSESPRASTGRPAASAYSIIICRPITCRRRGGYWSHRQLGSDEVAALLIATGHGFGGIVTDLHDAIVAVDMNDPGLQCPRLGIVEYRIGHDDDDIAGMHQVRRSAVDTNHAGATRTGDDIGLDPGTVGVVDDRDLFAFEQIGGIEEISIDRDRPDIVEVGL